MIDKLLTLFILLVKNILRKFRFSTGPKDRIYNYIQHHIKTNDRILNIGCGDGILSDVIRSNFNDINAVHDVDVVDLRHNKQSVHFTLFDGYHLSQYENNSFDIILVIYVLHHVPHRKVLLDELMRLGNKVIIIEDILHETHGTILDHFFMFTHRLWSRIVCKDINAYVQFWTKSKWFNVLNNYRTKITYTNIPEKKWFHYVDHGMFVCCNESHQD